MQVSENIGLRRSIRKFKAGAEISNEQIKLLLEAAMLAPSACNSRPWEFWVITNREKLNELADNHPNAKMLYTASLAIIVCGLPSLQCGLSEGFFPQDCAAATQNILLQAYDLGLGTCWCGVYPKESLMEEFHRILSIPEEIVPFNLIAVGVPEQEPKVRGFYDEERVKYIK